MSVSQGIVTPEAVVLDFDDAGIGSRAVAAAIDLAVRVVVVWAASLVALALGSDGSSTLAVVLLAGLVFSVVLIYPAVCELRWGRTPGKAALGLRVVTAEGSPVRVRHAATRAALALVDLFLLLGIPAILSALLTRRSQRLGDLAAGTVVVRERRPGAGDVPVSFNPFPGWEPYAASLDAHRLRPEQYGLVRTFLLRAHELTAAARWSHGTALSAAVARTIGVPEPVGRHPEAFLVAVAAAYQRRAA